MSKINAPHDFQPSNDRSSFFLSNNLKVSFLLTQLTSTHLGKLVLVSITRQKAYIMLPLLSSSIISSRPPLPVPTTSRLFVWPSYPNTALKKWGLTHEKTWSGLRESLKFNNEEWTFERIKIKNNVCWNYALLSLRDRHFRNEWHVMRLWSISKQKKWKLNNVPKKMTFCELTCRNCNTEIFCLPIVGRFVVNDAVPSVNKRFFVFR